MSIINFPFKYIWLVCYLKLRFSCLTCLRDQNRNAGVFQNKTNIEIIGF